MSTADTEDELEVHHPFKICGEGISDGTRNLNYTPSLQASPGPPTNANEPKRLQIIDYDTLGPIQRTCEQDVRDCSHETLQDILNDNMYFREKVAELTKDQERLNQQVRVLRSELKVQNGELSSQPGDPYKSICRRIASLERRLKVRQEFIDTCPKSKPKNRGPSPIESSVYKMGRTLESLSNRKEFRYPKTNHRNQEWTKDLHELLGRVFVGVQESAFLPDFHSQMSAGVLVQVIVGTAICEWVFESELRCTAMMKTPILENIQFLMSTIRKCAVKDYTHT
jgi:hypothetical protein